MSRRLALAVPLALALVGCSSGFQRPVEEVVLRPDSDGVQRITVVAHSYWFEPNRIVVKANEPVEIGLRNASWIVPHNFTCSAAEADIVVSADLGFFRGRGLVRFTPTRPGEYRFFCHVGSHAKKGMTGVIVVVP